MVKFSYSPKITFFCQIYTCTVNYFLIIVCFKVKISCGVGELHGHQVSCLVIAVQVFDLSSEDVTKSWQPRRSSGAGRIVIRNVTRAQTHTWPTHTLQITQRFPAARRFRQGGPGDRSGGCGGLGARALRTTRGGTAQAGSRSLACFLSHASPVHRPGRERRREYGSAVSRAVRGGDVRDRPVPVTKRRRERFAARLVNCFFA